MLKVTDKKDKIKQAIVISIMLHIIIFAVLIWSHFDAHKADASSASSSESTIDDAIMVTSGTEVQNYNLQQQQQMYAKSFNLREKQQASCYKQERIKQLEKGRFKKQETARKLQPKQLKEEASVEDKTLQKHKKKDEKVNQEVKKKAAKADRKNAAEKIAAAPNIAAAEKIANLFDDLSLITTIKNGGVAKYNKSSLAENVFLKNNGAASGADISNYAWQIKSAIESHFYDALSYAGKTCTLRMKLAPDGMLLDVQSEGGDQYLCTAALAAARQAKIPRPPSLAVYEVFKNVPLDFKP